MKNLIKSAQGAFLTAGVFIGSRAMAGTIDDKASQIGAAFLTKENAETIGQALLAIGLIMLLWAGYQYVTNEKEGWKKSAGGGVFLAILGAAFVKLVTAVTGVVPA